VITTLGLLEKTGRTEGKMDKKEVMEKSAEPETKLGEGDARILGEGEKVVAIKATTEKIEWKDKDIASATLLKLRPEMKKWECELIWRVIDDARKDPEEMDIEELYASATSVATENTTNYLVAAGGNKESVFALVMDKMMEMVAKEREQSATRIAKELRNMVEKVEGENRFLLKTQEGLMNRIAGYQEKAKEQGDPALLKKLTVLTREKEAAEGKAEDAQLALYAVDGDLTALKQQSGEDKRTLEKLQKKLVRANATLEKYEENEEEPGTVPAATLAQIKLLRDELGAQVSLLSDQLAGSKRETMLQIGGRMDEQDATIAGMFQHQNEVLMEENNARHARVESMFGSAMANMQKALQFGGGEFTPPSEDEIRRLEELRGHQRDEEKRIKSRQKATVALSRLEELHGLRERRCGVWLGFSRWAQYTAMELLGDIVHGRLDGTTSGQARMALYPSYSKRLNRDARGEIMEIEMKDMPKMANVVEDAAATTTPQQDEGEGGAQHTPTNSEQDMHGQQLDARQLATAMKLNRTPYSEYVSEDEDYASDGRCAQESEDEYDDDDDDDDMATMPAHDGKSAKVEARLKAKEMIDTSADDGAGNAAETDDEEEDEEEEFDEEWHEHLSTEKDLPMNPRHILSLNGLARVKKRANLAKDLLILLNKAHERHTAGKRAVGSTTTKILELWVKMEGLFETVKSKEMREEMDEWRAYAGRAGKHKARRESMDENRREADEYWSHHSNRYLAKSSEATLNQCLNICRSKQVYEAMLLKNGRTTAWHSAVKVFYHADSALNSRALIKFAAETYEFPIGELLYRDDSGCFVNEVLKTHRGMRPSDWNRRFWNTRKGKFDVAGNLIVQTAALRSKEAQSATRNEEKKDEEEGSEGSELPGGSDSDPEVDLLIDSSSSDSSGSDDEKGKKKKQAAKATGGESVEERAARKKAAKKAAKKKAKKRRSTMSQAKIAADLAQMKRDGEEEREKAAKKLAASEEKTKEVWTKTVKDGQTKLPELDGDMSKGYESGVQFKARAKGSLYSELQQIQALETQAVAVKDDGKSSPREPK